MNHREMFPEMFGGNPCEGEAVVTETCLIEECPGITVKALIENVFIYITNFDTFTKQFFDTFYVNVFIQYVRRRRAHGAQRMSLGFPAIVKKAGLLRLVEDMPAESHADFAKAKVVL